MRFPLRAAARLLGLACWAAALAASAATVLTLGWDPSPSPGVAEYRLYWGYRPRQYVGSWATTNLAVTVPSSTRFTVYFAATAVGTNGLESDFSNEVSWPGVEGERDFARYPLWPGGTNLVVRVERPQWANTGGLGSTGWVMVPHPEATITITNPAGPAWFKGTNTVIRRWWQ